MDWLTKKYDTTSECYYTAEEQRENYLFPLPLPLRYDSSFKYARSSGQYFDEYIELLVARTQNLTDLYPNYKDMPQYGRNPVTNESGWYYNTSGWVGGMEFTLRRKQYLPSLQTMCRELVPKGKHTFNMDGSLDKSIEKESVSNSQETKDDDDYLHIVNYIRSCGPIGIKYVREILRIVCKVNWCTRTTHNKIFDFTEDWSKHPETSEIHKIIFSSLGGTDILNQQTDKKGKMIWTFTFTGKMDETATTKEMKKEIKSIRSRKQTDMWNRWDHFRISILPVMTENELAHHPTCAATDSTIVLPTPDKPERAVLTIKIEGMTCSEGYYEDESFKQTAAVQVPASLNFFQLHRVVTQTMNCEAQAARETHEWQVPNIAVKHQRPITDEACLTVQIGETYFVEDSRREDYGCRKDMFSKGNAIRQRISHTGIYCDRDMPLFEEENRWNRNMREDKSGSVYACIHSTCINSVFTEPGKVAVLQDGLVNYCTKWKLTCMKIEEYDGLLPLNPKMNCMLAKCLRGNPHDSIDPWNPWSVENANKQLFRDRGCLRRNLFRLGSPDYVSAMPWCEHKKYRPRSTMSSKQDDSCIPYPVAVQMRGVDHRPMFLYGEPPLPSSEEYETYVSTLRGRIKPEFLQDNVMGSGGRFAVPFGIEGFYNYDSDDSMPQSGGKSIGQVWTDQVDQEMRRIESMEPKKKKKAKGRKRKASSSAAEKKKTPKVEASTQQLQPSTTESPYIKPIAESLPQTDEVVQITPDKLVEEGQASCKQSCKLM